MEMKFLQPTGKYKIGYFDNSLSYECEGTTRQLGFRCFYPAVEVKGEAVNYLDEQSYKEFEKLFGKGPMCEWYKVFTNLPIHCYNDATIADGMFKTVIYSPGLNNVNWGNLSQIQELVSNGYIVFAVSRAGESIATIDGDKVIGRDVEALKSFNDELVKNMVEAEEYFQGPTFVDVWSIKGMQKYVRDCKIATQLMNKWSKDIMEILNHLENVNKDRKHILFKKIDCSKFGVFGNNFGGVSSLNAATMDKRIACGVNMGGWLFGGKLLDERLEIPALVYGKSQKHFTANYGTHNDNITSLVFKRTFNEYMSDLCLIKAEEIKAMHQKENAIDGELMAQISSEAILNFFNNHLKNEKVLSVEELVEKYSEEIFIGKGEA